MNRLLLGIVLVAPAACTASAPIRESSRAIPSEALTQKTTPVDAGALCAGPELTGFVQYVRNHTVQITLGSYAGVRVGDAFYVWTWDYGYIGRVRITDVMRFDAWGVFIPGTAVPYDPQPGDRVEDAHMWHEYR